MKTNRPVRGEVWLADFGGRKGDEICKSRPCVVVSADGLGKLRLKVVVPITGWKPRYGSNPWMVVVHRRERPDQRQRGRRIAGNFCHLRTVPNETRSSHQGANRGLTCKRP